MRRTRFTIASLLGLVVLVAVAIAALRGATDIWDSALLGLTVLALLTSVLLAVHRTDNRRAFWLGFCLFGSSYLVASLVPPIETRLPTTKALVAVGAFVARPDILWDDDLIITNVRSFDTSTPATTAPSPPGRWDVTVFDYAAASPPTNYIKRLVGLPGGNTGNFVRIGLSLLACVMAYFGGCLSRWLYASGRPVRADREVVPTPSHPLVVGP